MRELSVRQVRRCENAKSKRCRCRCGGKLHGVARIPLDAPRDAFEDLPQGDAHKLRIKVRQRPFDFAAAEQAHLTSLERAAGCYERDELL